MNTRVTNNNLAIPHPLYGNGPNQHFSQDRAAEDNSRREFQARNNTASSDFVFRGELLDSVDDEKRYRPQYNQQIAPQNRQAIEIYQSSETQVSNSDPRGRLLDQFV
ncbi:MAG: hypothetical protein GY763_02855 [Gammaproteobacteria bacterium]|nr:hypothetical protein [Gammaproteobacteria bacterium]